MSQALEVRRAARATVNSLNMVLELMPDVIRDHAALTEDLTVCSHEVNKAKTAADVILAQKGLQTAGVVAGSRMIESHSKTLCDYLVGLKGPNKKALLDSTERLKMARRSLTEQIRRALVGVEKSDGQIMVDLDLLKKTEDALKASFQVRSGYALHLSSLLAKLKPNAPATGKLSLTDGEYQNVTMQMVEIADPEAAKLSQSVKSRIIVNCLAMDQSIQLLAPVDEDLWHNIAFIKIEGLVAKDDAIQTATSITLAVLLELLDRQDRRIANKAAGKKRRS